MKRKLRYKAPAKINLFLEVTGKRNDGFHEIQTIFSTVELYDNLNFVLTKNSGVKILTDTDFLKQEENLVYKVAVFIKEKYKVKSSVEIELEKRIPIAAGLGGGSSDAATTIIALNQLWELGLSLDEMDDIASRWGSDINFFLRGNTALGEGRGEIISSLAFIDLKPVILVNPGIGIPSALAYKLISPGYKKEDYSFFLANPHPRNCINRLEQGIRKEYPVIDNLINELQRLGATKAMLSGSGATVIGFCPDLFTAQKINQYYTNKGYWNTITKTKGEPNEHYRCKGFYS